jgi:hypothetical protein
MGRRGRLTDEAVGDGGHPLEGTGRGRPGELLARGHRRGQDRVAEGRAGAGAAWGRLGAARLLLRLHQGEGAARVPHGLLHLLLLLLGHAVNHLAPEDVAQAEVLGGCGSGRRCRRRRRRGRGTRTRTRAPVRRQLVLLDRVLLEREETRYLGRVGQTLGHVQLLELAVVGVEGHADLLLGAVHALEVLAAEKMREHRATINRDHMLSSFESIPSYLYYFTSLSTRHSDTFQYTLLFADP